MANKQPKKLKLKEYRVPHDHHFLFIKNPWPFDESVSTARNRQAYCNAVVGWICCMVQDLCEFEIHRTDVTIFWQSTHRDIIADIELSPSDTCPNPSVEPLLGAHHSSVFLTKKHAGTGNTTSTIYQYYYERFNAPQKTNWTLETANYSRFPLGFAIKSMALGEHTYPAPGPTEIKKLATTKLLPGRLILGHPECLPQILTPQDTEPAPQEPPCAPPPPSPQGNVMPPPQQNDPVAIQRSPPPPEAPHSPRCTQSPVSPSPSPPAVRSPPPAPNPTPSEFAFTPYERAPHFPRSHTVRPTDSRTKNDPYEEEAAALERLRSPGADGKEDASAQVKSEPKTEKEEYEPTPELAALAPLPWEEVRARNSRRLAEEYTPLVKQEGVVKSEYEPRPDLVALADKVQRECEARALRDGERAVLVFVKPEPEDATILTPVDMPIPTPRAREGVKHEQKKGTLNGTTQNVKKEESAPFVKREDGGAPRIKQEVKSEYEPLPELAALVEKVQQARRERSALEDPAPSIKPEPTDAPMPRARASNRRMDPFDEYEAQSVKQEEDGEFNTRQPPLGRTQPRAAYPPPPRVKEEEVPYAPDVPRRSISHTYSPGVVQGRETGAQSASERRSYHPEVKREYNNGGYTNRANWQPPAPSSFRSEYSEPSQRIQHPNHPYREAPPTNNYLAPRQEGKSRNANSYTRQPSRTFSPPPRLVKRERDAHDDLRPYPSAKRPPVKHEPFELNDRSEAYGRGTHSTYTPPTYSPTRDPRLRAKIAEREEREREAMKRLRTE
ncbi:hypothetical protein DFH09DRAFT_324881 [Mycena vulgaris]|nr:hypothetical protein DFH09DRAFT_324881 [Mycena vulgaris]